jgi:thiol-disulfide isomerase/thioredoxin
MKIKSFLVIAFLSATGQSHAQEAPATDSFSIGVIFPPKTIVSKAQLDGEDRTIKIIKITDKDKTFRGTVQNYGLFTLRLDYFDSSQNKILINSIPLFIVPGYTEIVLNARSPIIQINGVSARPRFEYALMMKDDQDYMDRVEEMQNNLTKAEAGGNTEQVKQAKKKLQDAEESRKEKLYAAFVRRNPNSPVALYAMDLYSMINSANPLEAEALLNGMPDKQQNSPRMIHLRKWIEKNKTTMVGSMAPQFTQTDTSGKPLALKALQGNYVLLDFWASWCHPCREQNPSLVKLYEKYKSKGFTILAVSLDSKKESWIKAIHQDKLKWNHVSDLHFWDNEAARLYGITSVPQNFLLDPNGKIIAKNLHGQDLEQALDEAYKNSTAN